MGEKVILREQVKELFNKKYGMLITNNRFILLCKCVFVLLKIFQCFICECVVFRWSFGFGSLSHCSIQVNPCQSRLAGGVWTSGWYPLQESQYVWHSSVGKNPAGPRWNYLQYQNPSTVSAVPDLIIVIMLDEQCLQLLFDLIDFCLCLGLSQSCVLSLVIKVRAFICY